jgi:hypothetical protein
VSPLIIETGSAGFGFAPHPDIKDSPHIRTAKNIAPQFPAGFRKLRGAYVMPPPPAPLRSSSFFFPARYRSGEKESSAPPSRERPFQRTKNEFFHSFPPRNKIEFLY